MDDITHDMSFTKHSITKSQTAFLFIFVSVARGSFCEFYCSSYRLGRHQVLLPQFYLEILGDRKKDLTNFVSGELI